MNPDFDAAKSRDLEWAVWNRGERILSLPRNIAVRNCGYIPPPDNPPAATNDATKDPS
jgi:hypothetical protein